MNHIEDITKISENREPQRAYYIPQNEGAYTLLNGKWNFSYYADGKNDYCNRNNYFELI